MAAASLRIFNPRLLRQSIRLFSFASPEEAAAERRRRKRRLRIEPPLSSHRRPQNPNNKPNPNPNSPKLPDPVTSLSGPRLTLHSRILTLIRENDLDEASLLVRHSIYSNCRPTVFTCNAVLSALLRHCRYSDLLSLHRFITQASVSPTIITHNLLLQAYCDCRKTDAALDHYRLLLSKEDSTSTPSMATYRILSKALVDTGRIDQALAIKDDMLSRASASSPPDAAVYNILIGALDPDRALQLFDELSQRLPGARGTSIVCGNAMKAYFKKGMEEEAMVLYKRALRDGSEVKFDAASYNFVLDALARNGRLEEAAGLFERMATEHDPPKRVAVNLGSFNVMVDGFCLAQRFEEAVWVFRVRMKEMKCVPDVLSYNNLIDHLGKNGLVAEAEGLYQEMGDGGFDPNEYTYTLLVESCFGAGRLDDAVQYFEKMVGAGLRPNANAYNKVIGGLTGVRRLDEARAFLDCMVDREVRPSVASYEMLVRSFCEAARLGDALKALKDLLMDEGVSLTLEMKELVLEALRKEAREEDFGKLLEDVEKEKAEAAARAAEEKARAEALAKEEEERKKAEKAAKEAAAAKASAAAIEAVLGKRKTSDNNKEEESSQSADDHPVTTSESLKEDLLLGESNSATMGNEAVEAA